MTEQEKQAINETWWDDVYARYSPEYALARKYRIQEQRKEEQRKLEELLNPPSPSVIEEVKPKRKRKSTKKKSA